MEMNLKRKNRIKSENNSKNSRQLMKKAQGFRLTCSVDLGQLARERRAWQ